MSRSQAPKVTFEITGVEELDRKLAEMPIAMRKKPLRKATREVAKLTKAEAKADAPHLTGELEASIVVRAGKRRRGKYAKYQVSASVVTKEGMFRGDTFYGAMVEFGTEQRQTASGANRGAIGKNQHSFLRPALYSNIPYKRHIFMRAVGSWIRQQREKGG